MRTVGGWSILSVVVVLVVALAGWWAGALPAVGAASTATALVRIGSGETPSYTVSPGAEQTITVEVVDAANVASATVLLTYDPALVQVTGCVARTPDTADLALCNPSYSTGVVRFSLLAADGVDGTFALFDLTLRALATSGTTAQLALTAPQFADVAGVEMPVDVSGGALVISGPDLPAEATLRLNPADSTLAPGQLATVGVQLDVATARPVASATMLLQYDPQIVRPVQCTAAAGSTLQGGCNVNFNRTQGLVKFNLLSVDGASGLLDLYDIVFEVVGTAVPDAVSPLTLSAETIMDAQSTPLRWRGEGGSIRVAASPSNAAQLRVGDAQSDGNFSLEHGAVITVPVWVADVVNLGAATVELGFDPALLEPLGCTANTTTPGIDGGQCVIEADRVLANFVSGQGFSGSAALFEVVFTPRAGAPTGEHASLLLDAANFADVNALALPWRGRSGVVTLLPGAPSNAPLFALDAPVAAPPMLAQDGQLSVTLSISGAVQVGVATVVVAFDPAVARVVSCTPNTAFDGAVCALAEDEARITILAGSGFSGPADMATLVFQAADNVEAGAQTSLDLRVLNFTDVDGNALRYQVSGGAIRIAAASLARDVLLQVTPAAWDVVPGRQFAVQVEALIDALKLAQGLDVVTLRLRYDPAVLRPLTCVPNTDAFTGGGCNPSFESGQIRLSLIGGGALADKLSLAQIAFATIGQPGDSTPLQLEVDTLLTAASTVPSYRTQSAQVTVTRDGDGVADVVENGAPNNGDGNVDGIPDAEQPYVVSLPSPVTGGYVTLIAPPSSCLLNVRFVPNPSPTDTPIGWRADFGFLDFTLGCLTPGSNATVTVILHGVNALNLNQFYIYASADTPAATGWQSFLREGDLGALFTTAGIDLRLGDGRKGDNDAAANGEIAFLGAPGTLGVGVGIVPRSLVIAPERAGTYGVVLLARPQASVLVNLCTGGRVVASPEQLIFSLDNWSVMQTVTVRTASGLSVPNADVIQHSVNSTDTAFAGLTISDVAVTVQADVTPTPTATGTPSTGTPTTGTPTTGTPTTGTPTTGTPSTGTPTTGTPTSTPTPVPGQTLTATPTPALQIFRIEPNQGISTAPNEVTIFGVGLRADTRITIGGVTLGNYTQVDAQGKVSLAVVPRGLTPGVYDVRAENPGGVSFSLPGGYTVIDDGIVDLSVANSDIWFSPVTVRTGTEAEIGVNVHRAGGDETLAGVDVAFYLNTISSATLLGRRTTAALAPGNDVIASVSVGWRPTTVGSYTVYALVDPDGAVAEGAETNNVAHWSVQVLPPPDSMDTTPPIITTVTPNNSVQSTTQQDVTLKIEATDDESGLYSMYLVERVYNNAARAWVVVQESGWITFTTPYVFHLSPVAGVHYLRVWVADGEGNVSNTSAGTSINYLPARSTAQAGQVRIYRLVLAVGNQLRASVTPLSGDPDVYVWDEGSSLVAYSNLDNEAQDLVEYSITRVGVYQTEVHGYSDSEYAMTLEPGLGQSARSVFMPTAKELPRSPAVSPLNVPPEQQALPAAPVAPPPNAISLVSFRATYRDDLVSVDWVTGWEHNTLGFHVYRGETNAYADAQRLTQQLIPGTGSSSGASYTFADATALPDRTYWYWLVEQEFYGATNVYGPTSTTVTLSAPPRGSGNIFLPLVTR